MRQFASLDPRYGCCKPWRKTKTPLRLMPGKLAELGGLAMARKARKKSASKAKKKSTTITKKKRKTVAKNKSKVAARKQAARKAKPKGVIATIVGDFEAVVDTLADAERLHRKLEPRGSPESES